MKVPLEQVEPGAVVETPELVRMLGWSHPTCVFMKGIDASNPVPSFLGSVDGKLLDRVHWPVGVGGVYVPSPKELSVVKDSALLEARRKQLLKPGAGWMLGMHYSSGCDPEFFVVDGQNQVIPATSFLRSKKYSPSMFYDGLQAEISPTPYGCLEQLSVQIQGCLSSVQGNARMKYPESRVTLRNNYLFSSSQMQGFDEEAVRFRCSTSMNIYDDLGEQPEAREYPWRFAGGHIHIGCQKRSAGGIKLMVRALDGLVGVAGVSLARNWDNPERRRTYGRAGEFRLPKHGLEYRTLSNFWLSSPLIFHLVFELARYAYRIGESGAFNLLYEGTEDEVRNCINQCDVKLAGQLIERNAPLYSKIFGTIWQPRAAAKAMETLRNGLEVAVEQPDAIVANWERYHGSYPQTWGRTFE